MWQTVRQLRSIAAWFPRGRRWEAHGRHMGSGRVAPRVVFRQKPPSGRLLVARLIGMSVPTADPPALRASKAEKSETDVPARMDPHLVRTIYGEVLLARGQWLEFPETVT